MVAALLAVLLGFAASTFFIDLGETFSTLGFFLIAWGIPAAIVAPIATYIVTISERWIFPKTAIWKLVWLATRTVALGYLLFIPLHVFLGFVVSGGDLLSTRGDQLVVSAIAEIISLAVGFVPAVACQSLVFYLALGEVSSDELERVQWIRSGA